MGNFLPEEALAFSRNLALDQRYASVGSEPTTHNNMSLY